MSELSVVGQRDMILPLQGIQNAEYGSDSESEANILPAQCSPPAPETATMLHAAPGWTSLWAWGRTAVTHPEKRSGFSAAWDGGQKWSVFTADCVPRRTNLGPGGGGNRAAMWENAVLGYKGRHVRVRELCTPIESS